MNAYFLGGPLHKTEREDPQKTTYRYREVLQKKEVIGRGWKPKIVADAVIYLRDNNFPVYIEENYLPDPDDEESVLEWMNKQTI